MPEAIIESRSRETLERTIAEQFQRQGYTLLWIVEAEGDSLPPRVVEGGLEGRRPD